MKSLITTIDVKNPHIKISAKAQAVKKCSYLEPTKSGGRGIPLGFTTARIIKMTT